MNFINCPASKFYESGGCKAVKTFVKTNEKCGEKFEDIFILDNSYWNPDDENKI